MEENKLIINEIDNETIKSMVYIIRGQKVMFDFDLAKIYGYTTKRLNEQVKNNIAKFPERYRFQLTKLEVEDIQRSNFSTTGLWAQGAGGRVYLPYVFTEQGVYMLMTVLKGDLATKQSIDLIDTFKEMKDYIIENRNIISSSETIHLLKLINKNTEKIDKVEEKLEIVMDNFINPNNYKHFLILDGHKFEADIAYQSIYNLARKSIYIIDKYIDVKTLQLLRVCNPNIEIIIFSDNKSKNQITSDFLNDYKNETGLNICFKSNNNKFHDRYIVLDFNTKNEKYYHCGSSSKDAGKNITTIYQIEDVFILGYKRIINEILSNKELKIK